MLDDSCKDRLATSGYEEARNALNAHRIGKLGQVS